MTIQQQLQSLDVEQPIYLIELTITGQTPLRVCNNANVSFGGVAYTGLPLTIEYVGKSGEGTELSSKLSISDINGQIGQLLDNYADDIIGAIVSVKRTLSMFLDSGSNPDATQYTMFSLRINQWVGEYGVGFEFTLIPSVSLERKKLPGRTFLRRCGWEFRDVQCAASTALNFDVNGNPTTVANAVCAGKDLTTCEKYQNTARYGGFPGVIRGQ
ncbi:MAG: hypothetical protein V7L23_15350 [Nostoc sp.]|uniref:hypothetical protein n=1 Tax=Nostoc sp. TaxID=1180 RepID=UPI002FEFBCBB